MTPLNPESDTTNSSSLTAPDGMLLSRDLMFQSKVTGTAAALGFRVQCSGSQDDQRLQLPLRAIFVDLACLDFDPLAVMQGLAATRPRVIAFGSHVDTARLQAARDAGCDEVLPRSRFSAELPDLLRRVLAPGGN